MFCLQEGPELLAPLAKVARQASWAPQVTCPSLCRPPMCTGPIWVVRGDSGVTFALLCRSHRQYGRNRADGTYWPHRPQGCAFATRTSMSRGNLMRLHNMHASTMRSHNMHACKGLHLHCQCFALFVSGCQCCSQGGKGRCAKYFAMQGPLELQALPVIREPQVILPVGTNLA